MQDNPSNVTNLLFLVAKYHIYRMTCLFNQPNIRIYKEGVPFMRDIEKYNATKSGMLHKHYKKWYNSNINASVDQAISDNFIRDYIDQM